MTFSVTLDYQQRKALALVVPGNVVTLAMGRGTGKTFLDRVLIHTVALQNPGIHIGLLMPTLKQARQVFWPQLLDDYEGPLRAWLRGGKPNKSFLEAVYTNGSRLTTWGAENSGAIRGQRFGMVIEDEADDIDEATETAVINPTFSKVGLNFRWVKSGTPRRGRYGVLYRDFRRAQEGLEGYKALRIRSQDSPQVDRDWLLRQKTTTPPAIYAREYECDFDSAEGLVYPFEEEFHIRQAPPLSAFREFHVGVDWGWVDPTVLLLIGIQGHGADAVAWILDERYESEVPGHMWVDRAKQWNFATFWPDPSQPARTHDFRAAGLQVRDSDNSIEPGVARVAELLFKRPATDASAEWARMFVAPHCKNTIREFLSYRRKRDPKNTEAYLEDIEGRNDHAMDALRYAIVGVFGRAGNNSRHVASGR